jgi:hypothetical protein
LAHIVNFSASAKMNIRQARNCGFKGCLIYKIPTRDPKKAERGWLVGFAASTGRIPFNER